MSQSKFAICFESMLKCKNNTSELMVSGKNGLEIAVFFEHAARETAKTMTIVTKPQQSKTAFFFFISFRKS